MREECVVLFRFGWRELKGWRYGSKRVFIFGRELSMNRTEFTVRWAEREFSSTSGPWPFGTAVEDGWGG
jgi:hypothetical protein